MKKTLLTLSLLALMPTAQADTKIAVVDKRKVFYDCDAGKKFEAALQARIGDFQKFFAKEENTLRQKGQKLGPNATEAEVRAIEEQGMRLQKTAADKRAEFDKASASAEKLVKDQMQTIMTALRKEKGAGLLLDTAGVVDTDEATENLTAETIKRLNAQLPEVKVDLPQVAVEVATPAEPAKKAAPSKKVNF